MIRRDAQLGQRPMGIHPSQGGVSMGLNMPNGTPISVQTQMKKMPIPVGMLQPQPRISSNGGMCPPATPVVASMSLNSTQSSPPQMPPPPVQQPINGTNGANHSPSRAPEGEPVKIEPSSNLMPNGVPQSQPDTIMPIVDHRMPASVCPVLEPNPPSPLKSSQNQHLSPHAEWLSCHVPEWFSSHAKWLAVYASPERSTQWTEYAIGCWCEC